MRRPAYLAVLITLIAGGCAVNKQASVKDPVIATLGQTPIYASEFKYVFDKNSVNDSLSKEESLKQYLDLYVNFRLKVLEAESLGLDTLASFKQELEGYKQQLAEPYLLDSSVTESLVTQAYERMKEEIRASHILINLPQDADPKDTLTAFQKISEVRQKAAQGEDFATLAKANSQDPSAATSGGDLGYFTALQMVYPFEDAAYKTKVGEISMPFRTRFGYHIVKVYDRRPSQGKVKTAHIMVRTNPEAPEEEAKAANQKIDEIHKRLMGGEDWNQLTQQFSEDGASKIKGGELPAFTTGSMIPSFEEAAFALQKPGDFTSPVLTPYGWHIIKLLEKTGLEPFEELQTSLRQKVSRDSRSDLNKTLLLKRLKKENAFVEFADVKATAFKNTSDSLIAGKWNYKPDKFLQKTLFSIGAQKYSVEDFYTYVKRYQQAKPTLTPAYYMQLLYDEYVNQTMVNYEKAHLQEKYSDYKYLVREYRDGMLLFQQMENKVWSRSMTDSTGYKTYFENNRDKYKLDKHVTAAIYNVASQEVLSEVKNIISKKLYPVAEPVFKDILFENGKNQLTQTHKTQLDNLASALIKDETLQVEVAGNAGFQEDESLAGARAKMVTDYLVGKGVDITKIVVKDNGRFRPVSSTDRQKNRRVSIQINSTSKEAIEKWINARKPLSLEITEGTFQKGDNALIDQVEWKPGNYTLERDNRIVYIEITEVKEPRQKTLEEARGTVISDYQAYLEKQWIDELKTKYPVVIHEEEVKKLLE
ncbi:OmpA family protein [Rhodocytophaga rosea]|uniref:OmpA family protein n=1 Tax=Rhodocytophaga rosea TaxID=2704465 RepID=A0A6C0GE59_9BACT|nr:peptidylprolyl isomerase [Rhodocytophaga rosea]QHT65970.1 OmpA family protein [Rhodocytophaga rosea]